MRRLTVDERQAAFVALTIPGQLWVILNAIRSVVWLLHTRTTATVMEGFDQMVDEVLEVDERCDD